MNLPQLTMLIGETDLIDFPIKTRINEGEKPYVIMMIFDLIKDQIYFKVHCRLTDGLQNDYLYRGNNIRSSFQYYVIRETVSLKYLLTQTWTELYLMLKNYNLKDGELFTILEKLKEHELVYLGQKKGEGCINFSKIIASKREKEMTKLRRDDINDKGIIIDNKLLKFEEFIKECIGETTKTDRFILVVPAVIMEDGRLIEFSKHPDYINLVGLEQKLVTIDNSISNDRKRNCYLCKKSKSDVYSSQYSNKFEVNINKIFTTTTINAAPNLCEYNYDDAYSFCNDCYQKLRAGGINVLKRFKTLIANENAFILPEGLFGNFDYSYLNKVKQLIDFAFDPYKNVQDWMKELEGSAEFDNINNYTVNFVIYRAPKNTSITILLTIEDVPTIYIKEIMKQFAHNSISLFPHIRSVSLNNIYRLIPVRTIEKKGKREQVDIIRILTLYKSILRHELINTKALFGYAIEALDKGLIQLNKSKFDNYFNMGLSKYIQYRNKEDIFIKHITMSYLVLIKTCEDLNLLDKPIFKQNREEVASVVEFNSFSEKVNNSINEKEIFR